MADSSRRSQRRPVSAAQNIRSNPRRRDVVSEILQGTEAERLRAFLADSLALWQVAGSVQTGVAPVIVEIRGGNGAMVWIERAADDTPFRWYARWRAAGDAPGGVRELRPRACGSLVGLLAAVRDALGVERGNALRVVAAS